MEHNIPIDDQLAIEHIDSKLINEITTFTYSMKPFATNGEVTKDSIPNTIDTSTTQPKTDSFYYDFDDSTNSFNEIYDETTDSITYTFDDTINLPPYTDYSNENIIVSETLTCF